VIEPDLLLLLIAYLLGCAASCVVLAHRRPFGARRGPDRAEAEGRAEALLKDLLTEDEYRRLSCCGYLELRSPSRPGRTYRVPRQRGQVRVYGDGVPIMALCVQSVEPIPDGDAVLLHKLMIEGDEATYLRVANRFRVIGHGPSVWREVAALPARAGTRDMPRDRDVPPES
jgi:hypothetical protein